MQGTIATTGAVTDVEGRQTNESDKEVIIKNCAPSTDCISEINDLYIDDVKDLME